MFRYLPVGLLMIITAAVADIDPTRPLNLSTQSRSGVETLRLQSILFSGSRRIAVINGTVLAVGERIGDAAVVKIEAQRVVVDQQGKKRVLTLPNAAVKTVSTNQ